MKFTISNNFPLALATLPRRSIWQPCRIQSSIYCRRKKKFICKFKNRWRADGEQRFRLLRLNHKNNTYYVPFGTHLMPPKETFSANFCSKMFAKSNRKKTLKIVPNAHIDLRKSLSLIHLPITIATE